MKCSNSDSIGLRRNHKRSRLNLASNVYHVKKAKVLKAMNLDVDTYNTSLLQRCNNAVGINCILDHFSNDRNQVYSFAKATIERVNTMTFKEYRNEVFNIFKSLPRKHDSVNSHIQYQIQFTFGGKYIECCRSCFMVTYIITDSFLEKMKKSSRDTDVNYKNNNSKEAINGQEFADLLSRNKLNDPEFHINYLPGHFHPLLKMDCNA
jgi:isocitrate dehydrogenase